MEHKAIEPSLTSGSLALSALPLFMYPQRLHIFIYSFPVSDSTPCAWGTFQVLDHWRFSKLPLC